MGLDKKLKDITSRVAIHGVRAEATQALPPAEAIEAIKQVFIADGWVKIPQVEIVTRWEAGKKPEVYMVDGKEVMTGPEWYERFDKEMRGELFPYSKEDKTLRDTIVTIRQAARRAAGVDE